MHFHLPVSLKENIQVAAASVLGLGSPGINHFIEVVEPMLQVLLTVGQIGVAIATILYIFRKWKQAAKKTRRARKSKDETP